MGTILGNGDGTFGKLVLYFTGVATTYYGTGCVSVFLGYGNGTFAEAEIFSADDRSSPRSITVDDDRHLDIIVANEITYNVGVLYGNGDDTFQNVTKNFVKPDTGPQYALSGDINHSSFLDVAIANSKSNIGCPRMNGPLSISTISPSIFIAQT